MPADKTAHTSRVPRPGPGVCEPGAGWKRRRHRMCPEGSSLDTVKFRRHESAIVPVTRWLLRWTHRKDEL
jgi:hypothetical protein